MRFRNMRPCMLAGTVRTTIPRGRRAAEQAPQDSRLGDGSTVRHPLRGFVGLAPRAALEIVTGCIILTG